MAQTLLCALRGANAAVLLFFGANYETFFDLGNFNFVYFLQFSIGFIRIRRTASFRKTKNAL